jgi:NADPH:quinone reductase-like Zn-dependent oxidoreductase
MSPQPSSTLEGVPEPSVADRETMRAIIYNDYGPPERLEPGHVPQPTCGLDQVLIAVHAAGINPVDWKIRSGALRLLLPLRFPVVPGFDVSGRIEEVGAKAAEQGWKPGDDVFCYLNDRRGGGYAEYVAADASVLAKKPPNVSHEEAAGVPLAATTALQSIRDHGRLPHGGSVLVNGASGGVGTFAIQIAKALGGSVTGVASGKNLDLVRSLGADRVLDYTQEDFASQSERYDVIFDAVAKGSYRQCRKVLKPHGRYVTTLPSPLSLFWQAVTKPLGRRCINMLARPNGEDLRLIGRWMEEGSVRPVVDEVFPLEDAAEAHRKSERERARGKLVLRVR